MNGIISLADSGTVSALDSGTVAAAPQAIGGSWPSNPGTYYIVVHLSAVADVDTTNNAGASGVISMTVDYHLTITPPGTSVMTGDVMSVDYELSNSGNISGAATVHWTAYLSSDTNYGAGDSRIDSGSFAALAGTDSDPQTITVNSNWPAFSGIYYIILEWSSADDAASPEYGASGAYTVDVPDVDYGPGSTIPPGGPIVVGTIGNEIFRIENFGTDNGTQSIDWNAWLSLDAIPGNAGDIHVDFGTTGPLNTGVESGDLTVNIDWDIAPEDYNLIITWNASDDVNPANDSITSTALYIVRYPDVDYETSITPAGGGNPLIGDAISESFEIINSGTEDGAQNVDWSAWVSLDMTLNTGDIQVDSGSIGSLNSGISSGVLPITGNWPDIPGNYYLIVTWTATDDNDNTNDSMVSAAITNVRLPIYDYSITTVPPPDVVPTYIAGDAVTGSFSVQNLGGDDDASEGFSWTVYASSDTSFSIEDALIESRSDGAAQLAMDTPLVVNYSGFWPIIGGDYYIVVVIESVYDPVTANNEDVDAIGTSVVNLTDYEITNLNYHPLGVPGGALIAAPTPWTNPVYIPYEFTITEIGGRDGNKKVDYTVYASIDTILDVSDVVLKNTFIQANDIVLGGGSITVPFDDANPWPVFPTEYFIIITINAADDMNASNDRYVAGPVEVAAFGTDSDGNDSSGPFAGPVLPPDTMELTPVLPTGQLRIDELIRIDGVMEFNNGYDTYRFQAGPAMTSIYLELTWLTGTNVADMYLWDEASQEVNLEYVTTDIEGPSTIINILPNEFIYIGVKCLAGNSGTQYTLKILGMP